MMGRADVGAAYTTASIISIAASEARRQRQLRHPQIGFIDQLLREMNHAGEEAPVEARVPRQPGPVAGSTVQVHMHLVPIMKHRRCLVWPFPDLLVRPS